MRKVVDLLKKSKSILITTHHLPDGDGLGSEMALFHSLAKLGKKVSVINSSPTPEKFSLVDPQKNIQVFNGAKLPSVDLVIVTDTREGHMLGVLEAPVRSLKVPILFLDHHIEGTASTDANEIHFIDETMGSTGELVYRVIKALNVEIDFPTAIALYVALVTDTGSFRYGRTSPRSHLMAAELLQTGVKPEQVFREIYSRDSIGKLRLFGRVLSQIQTSQKGDLVWVVITRAMLKEFDATVEDTQSFVGHLLSLEAVKVGILFREDEGGVKVSLRSVAEISIVEIAQSLGGGGHRQASGVFLAKKSLAEAQALVLNAVAAIL